jgi:hypothetical protein
VDGDGDPRPRYSFISLSSFFIFHKFSVAISFASAFLPPYDPELLAQLTADSEPQENEREKRQVTDAPLCDTLVIFFVYFKR